MGRPTGLRCIRCGAEYTDGKLFKGCPVCLEQGHPANLVVEYDYADIRRHFDPRHLDGRPLSMWRYHELLPVEPELAVSIGEGNDAAGTRAAPRRSVLGLRTCTSKTRRMNPTWSFKDRLASAAVSFGQVVGASDHGLVVGQRRRGDRRVLGPRRTSVRDVHHPAISAGDEVQMGVYGTKLVAVPTIYDRWSMVEAGVDQLWLVSGDRVF